MILRSLLLRCDLAHLRYESRWAHLGAGVSGSTVRTAVGTAAPRRLAVPLTRWSVKSIPRAMAAPPGPGPVLPEVVPLKSDLAAGEDGLQKVGESRAALRGGGSEALQGVGFRECSVPTGGSCPAASPRVCHG